MKNKDYLPTDYRKFIAISRYSRWLEDEGRRETWDETVNRYVSNVVETKTSDSVVEELRYAILNNEVAPSMRGLMTAGGAMERDNTCLYNCAYTPVEKPTDFDKAMFILLCGTGVGFSVERQYVSKLPTIPSLSYSTDTESFMSPIVVADSKEGWAKALRKVIKALYEGVIPIWDVSNVRPAGTKLKTFGGRASGPAPLVELFNFVTAVFKGAQGRKLSSIECHDIMCKIGEVVVVGGVRRSAMISLSNLSDDRMRHAKSGNWWETAGHRALANNSVCYTEKPDMETFIREWSSLIESKSGERGIFNRVASKAQAAKFGRRDPNWEFGVNPCCFTGDMKLLTADGERTFRSLSGSNVSIVSHDGSITYGSVWSNGTKPTVFVQFSNGLHKKPIQTTSDHVFMLADETECQAGDLKGNRLKFFSEKATSRVGTDGFLAGFMVGDGNLNRLNSAEHRGIEVYFNREKDTELSDAYGGVVGSGGKVTSYSEHNKKVANDHHLPKKPIGQRGLPPHIISTSGLQGLYSANGCVVKGHRVSLKSIDKEQVYSLLEYLRLTGISSYITVNKSKKVKFSNGEYVCKESYDLNISRYESLLKFSKSINFGQTYKREALEQLLTFKSPIVTSVTEGPSVEVFDFTEPKNNWGVVEGIVVHNSEIILRPRQFCNLTECVIRVTDSIDDIERKVRLATILGTIQSTYTYFPYLGAEWEANTKEERLLGVSLTGIMDNPLMTLKNKGLEKTLEHLRSVAVTANAEWAGILGIPVSTAITCVKPSGTVSQLVDSASGIHPRHSEYYIRTVRGDNKDPLTQFMSDAGIPVEPCVMKPDTTSVFSFPVKSPTKCVTRNDLTAVEQMETWLAYQRFWCEHKPSITVTVRDEEWMEVGAFVYKHFDEMSGVSFLPHSDHTYQQAPYQEINKVTYETALALMPKSIDWDRLTEYEKEDTTKGSSTFACVGNCEVVDIT